MKESRCKRPKKGDAPTGSDRAQLRVWKAQINSAQAQPERLKLAQLDLYWLHWGKYWRNERTIQNDTSLHCQELRGPWPT